MSYPCTSCGGVMDPWSDRCMLCGRVSRKPYAQPALATRERIETDPAKYKAGMRVREAPLPSHEILVRRLSPETQNGWFTRDVGNGWSTALFDDDIRAGRVAIVEEVEEPAADQVPVGSRWRWNESARRLGIKADFIGRSFTWTEDGIRYDVWGFSDADERDILAYAERLPDEAPAASGGGEVAVSAEWQRRLAQGVANAVAAKVDAEAMAAVSPEPRPDEAWERHMEEERRIAAAMNQERDLRMFEPSPQRPPCSSLPSGTLTGLAAVSGWQRFWGR